MVDVTVLPHVVVINIFDAAFAATTDNNDHCELH